MVDAITDYAIIQLDVNGNVVRWCPGAQALTGYSAAEALDQPVSMFYTEEDRAAGLAEREMAVAHTSGRLEFAGWRIRKDGQRFRAGVVLAPMQDETGAVTGFTKAGPLGRCAKTPQRGSRRPARGGSRLSHGDLQPAQQFHRYRRAARAAR